MSEALILTVDRKQRATFSCVQQQHPQMLGFSVVQKRLVMLL